MTIFILTEKDKYSWLGKGNWKCQTQHKKNFIRIVTSYRMFAEESVSATKNIELAQLLLFKLFQLS